MKACLAALIVGGLLAGCASVPPSAMPDRDQIRDFTLEARFALRVSLPDQAAQSSGGRLSWTHKNGDNRILLSSPLGYGLAEIETTPERSLLRTADGKTLESSDPDALMEEVTGQRLPVSRLSAWLLGRASNSAQIENDERQRPTRLREAGWQVDYAYDDDASVALPMRLTLSRDQEIELRLRIEEWKENP
ncbi:MAG TPA: lipoprotein insertase outer membrane protein LolB [Azonexus sp.]|nr:lipoprotein insertase outer membrane protein LolB [Azonexus sp.]